MQIWSNSWKKPVKNFIQWLLLLNCIPCGTSLLHVCYVNLLRICRTPFFEEYLRGLLLLFQAFSPGTRNIIFVKFQRAFSNSNFISGKNHKLKISTLLHNFINLNSFKGTFQGKFPTFSQLTHFGECQEQPLNVLESRCS